MFEAFEEQFVKEGTEQMHPFAITLVKLGKEVCPDEDCDWNWLFLTNALSYYLYTTISRLYYGVWDDRALSSEILIMLAVIIVAFSEKSSETFPSRMVIFLVKWREICTPFLSLREILKLIRQKRTKLFILVEFTGVGKTFSLTSSFISLGRHCKDSFHSQEIPLQPAVQDHLHSSIRYGLHSFELLGNLAQKKSASQEAQGAQNQG